MKAETLLPAESAAPHPMSHPVIPDHELLAPIGHGSSGEVWLARNVMGLGRAVKLVRGTAGRGLGREYAAVQLYEPVSRGADGLVHVLHVGRLAGENGAAGSAGADGFFYIMELADDFSPAGDFTGLDRVLNNPAAYAPHTLRAELKREGTLSVSRCVEIGLALSAALLALHQAGLLHRDIKPSNIIFVHGRAKLADMGLLAGQEEAPSLVGTEGYMPPDGPGRPTGDLYALGMVLYEAATGLHPSDYPRLPDAWGRGENPGALELLEVIFHATEADPRRRYTQASALLADLAALANGTSLRSARQLRERLAWAKKASVAAAVVVGLAGAGLWLWKERAVSEARTHAAEQQARAAEAHGRAQSLVAALLHTGWVGDVIEARRVLGEALTAHPGDQLTAEALAAALLAPDLVECQRWQSPEMTATAGLALSPDGALLARHAAGGLIELVRTEDGAVRSSFSLAQTVWQVGPFAPGGRFLHLKLSDDWRHVIWDTGGTMPKLVTECGAGSKFVGFSTDGTRAAFWHRDRMELEWRSLTGGEPARTTVPQTAGATLYPSPDGRWWLTDEPDGGQQTQPRPQQLVEAASGKVVARIATTFFGESLAWAPNEEAVAVGSHDGLITILHTIPDWLPVQCTGHAANIVALAFSPDGRWLLSSSWDHTARLWDTATGREALRLPGWGFALGFVAGGRRAWRLVEAVKDMEVLEVLDWHPPLAQTLPAACSAGNIGQPHWHPNGRWLATDVGPQVWWWRAADLARVRRDTLPRRANAFAFLPVSGDLALCTWPEDAQPGLWRLRPQAPPAEGVPPVYELAECLRPGAFLAVESAADDTLLVRDSANAGTLLRPGQPPVPLSGRNDFWGIAISPDGRHLATSRWNEPNVLFFDAAAQRAGKFATELCTQPVFSPDGHRLFAVDQDVIFAWDTATVQPLWRTLRERSQMGAGWCAVSPDSRWLAATLDEAPALLDAATGAIRLRLTTPGHARIDRLAWSPDGRQLAARLIRGGLVVWQTGALLDALHTHGALVDVMPGPSAP